MHFYSIITKPLTNPTVLFQIDADIDTLLPGYLPYELTKYAAQAVERTNNIYDTMLYVSNEQTIAATWCLHSTSPSTLLDWPTAYTAEKDSSIIIKVLRKYKTTYIPLDIINSIHTSYMPSIKKGNIVLLGDKLLLFKAMNMDSKIISFIIVPTSLRRTLFDHYHGGPSGGHVGEYKILYHIRMRFFWPGLMEEIKKWVAACAHCVS